MTLWGRITGTDRRTKRGRRARPRAWGLIDAIVEVYLSGTNIRRIKGALAPLLRGRGRDLAEDQMQYLIMDGWYPKVRIGKAP